MSPKTSKSSGSYCRAPAEGMSPSYKRFMLMVVFVKCVFVLRKVLVLQYVFVLFSYEVRNTTASKQMMLTVLC